VKNPRANFRFPDHPERLLVGVAVVDDDRQFQFMGQFELPGKHFHLFSARRQITEVIQADLTVSDNFRVCSQLTEFIEGLIAGPGHIVRMDANRCVNVFILPGNRQGLAAQRQIGSNGHNTFHTRKPSTLNHLIAIGVELLHLQVGVGVNHHYAYFSLV